MEISEITEDAFRYGSTIDAESLMMLDNAGASFLAKGGQLVTAMLSVAVSLGDDSPIDAILNPKSYFPKEYVYEQLSSYIVIFVRMAEARKTTMGHITTDHLEQSKIPLPPESLLKQFVEKIRPIHLKIGQTKQENRELAKLRDWLLPMLMNGQARVE